MRTQLSVFKSGPAVVDMCVRFLSRVAGEFGHLLTPDMAMLPAPLCPPLPPPPPCSFPASPLHPLSEHSPRGLEPQE